MASVFNSTTVFTILNESETALLRSVLTTDASEMNISSKTPTSEIAARSAFLIIITLLSMFGNSIVFITLYRRQYLLTPSNKLVFSLTSANFAFSCIVMPFVIYGSVTEQWSFGKVWCSITGFLTLLVKGASMLLLAGIACDRYYAIVHPMSYPRKITGFRSTVVIILCWLVAAICAAPPLFGGWSQYDFHPQRSGCLPLWRNQVGFTLFWVILCFFFPYCTMLGCYFSIFKVARTKTRQVNIKVDCTPRHSSEDDMSNSQDSDSYTDAFPATRVMEDATPAKDVDNTEGDSGINMSGSTRASTAPSDSANESRTRPKEPAPKMYSDCTRLYLPNQVECKDSPKFASRRRSNIGLDSDLPDDVPIKNSRKSSNASIISSTSQVFRRTSLAFSAVKYYSNQMKAVFTIAFILGILLCTMGPFIVVALVEAFQSAGYMSKSESGSPVSELTLSVSTCFFYLTCVYYPLIYGLWNRTVRKEMRRMLCKGKPKESFPTRVRILSLATHIQDLGMSPGLTAAIISGSETGMLGGVHAHDRSRRRSAYNLAMQEQEPVPVFSNKRRHTLHTLPAESLPQASNGGFSFHGRHGGTHSWVSRDAFRSRHDIGVIEEECEREIAADASCLSNNNMRRWRNGYSFPTVTDLIEEKGENETATIVPPKNHSEQKTKQNSEPHPQLTRCHSMKSRAREKPATSGLFELTSAEVLSNAALSSALLFTGSNAKSNNVFDIYSLTNGSMTNGSKEDDYKPLPASPTIVISDADHLVAHKNDGIVQKTLHTTVPDEKTVQNMDFSSDSNHDTVIDSNVGLCMNFDQNHTENQPIDAEEDCDSHESAGSPSLPTDGLNSDGRDAISLLTGGLLHGSNLIHLEAGEPISVRKWSESQFVDFFASSVAYGVVEASKSVAHGRSEDKG